MAQIMDPIADLATTSPQRRIATPATETTSARFYDTGPRTPAWARTAANIRRMTEIEHGRHERERREGEAVAGDEDDPGSDDQVDERAVRKRRRGG